MDAIEQLDFGWKTPRKPRKKKLGRPAHTGRDRHEKHEPRPAFRANTPVHVTMRVVTQVGSLRRGKLYRAIRRATAQALAFGQIRIVHISIQRDHVHAILETLDRETLATGMQGFLISAARQINRACGHRGRVFADRYHVDPLTKPRHVRNAIAYVLNNWRKHGEDRGSCLSVDGYSSAVSFDGWRTRPEHVQADERLVVSRPSTWLLAAGWIRHGLIDPDEVPGSAQGTQASAPGSQVSATRSQTQPQ